MTLLSDDDENEPIEFDEVEMDLIEESDEEEM